MVKVEADAPHNKLVLEALKSKNWHLVLGILEQYKEKEKENE